MFLFTYKNIPFRYSFKIMDKIINYLKKSLPAPNFKEAEKILSKLKLIFYIGSEFSKEQKFIEILSYYGIILIHLEEYNKAIIIFRWTVCYINDKNKQLDEINKLILCLSKTELYDEAELMYESLIEAQKILYGKNHIIVCQTSLNYLIMLSFKNNINDFKKKNILLLSIKSLIQKNTIK